MAVWFCWLHIPQNCTFPVDDLSVRTYGASVCPVHCGKTVDRIRMPFGIIGRPASPRMRQVLGFGNRSTGMGTFRVEFGPHHCNQWGLYGVCVRQRRDRRGPLPKLLWANLFPVQETYLARVYSKYQPPRSTLSGNPSPCVGAVSRPTSQWVVILCGCEVRAGRPMVRVWTVGLKIYRHLDSLQWLL